MKLFSSGLPNFESLKHSVNIRALRNTVHPKLEQLINKMTNYEADYRFNSVNEIIYKLDLLLDLSPYKCFSSDLTGFIDYMINKNIDNYFYI